MKRFVLTSVLVLALMIGKAQNIGLFAGPNLMFKSFLSESQFSFNQTLSTSQNYSVGLEVDDLKILNLPFKLTAKYNTYSGNLFYNNNGNGGGYEANINHQSQNLSLGLQYSKTLKNNKLRYSFGLEYSYLLKEDFSGYTFQYDWVNGATHHEISPETNNLYTTHRLYLVGTFGYLMQFAENWFVLPQITLHASLNKELEFGSSARSFKILAELGMGRRI